MEQTVSWPGWETVRLIGRGSFGAVYEIQRTLFGEVEKAALKVITIPQSEGDIEELRSSGFDEESITDTFRNHLKSILSEYSLMRKMNGSANIVNCDDVRYVQHEDGIGWDIYIKMELLTPLAKALPDSIPEETVIKIATDLCSALELCKEYNIVHRDIKPQNIFVSRNHDYKLGDFGVAKTVEKTMGGTKIGTYKYMAPEVYNNQPYGSAADIYSLGLVLYWLLNERRMPFLPLPPTKLSAGMDEAARSRRLSGEPIPAPRHGSEELKRIVLKACSYEPRERYTDAHQMKEALSRLSVASEEPDKTVVEVPHREVEYEETEQVSRDPILEGKTVVEEKKPVSPPQKKRKFSLYRAEHDKFERQLLMLGWFCLLLIFSFFLCAAAAAIWRGENDWSIFRFVVLFYSFVFLLPVLRKQLFLWNRLKTWQPSKKGWRVLYQMWEGLEPIANFFVIAAYIYGWISLFFGPVSDSSPLIVSFLAILLITPFFLYYILWRGWWKKLEA